jgi:rhodanese-related sulfurtransferase
LEIAEEDGIELIDVSRLLHLRAEASDHPLYIVDVRMPHEYIEGHIPGALTCPGGQVAFSDDQIAIRGASLVTVCDGRARAVFAASLWKQMGFPRVYALDGGVRAWAEAGNPLERGGEERPFVGGGTRTREQMIEYLRWEEELGAKYQSS